MLSRYRTGSGSDRVVAGHSIAYHPVATAPGSVSSDFHSAGANLSNHDTPKRELRVLQVFSVLGVGGAETWLMSLLKYFHENNQELPV